MMVVVVIVTVLGAVWNACHAGLLLNFSTADLCRVCA